MFKLKTQRAKRTFGAVDINVCYADELAIQRISSNDRFSPKSKNSQATALTFRAGSCLSGHGSSCHTR